MKKKLLTLSLVSFMFIPIVNSKVTLKNENDKDLALSQVVKLKSEYKDFNGDSLTIYNCADYIDEELISEFEERYNCVVNYYTFDTPETMYNQLTLQPEGTYDLLCPSDYMIQRLVREGLVEPLDVEKETPVYAKYSASNLRTKLKSMKADTNNDGVKDVDLDKYTAGYMWGTLGIIYDPYCSDTIREDVKSWDVFWDKKYNDLISIKNSMRDTFVVGLMHGYTHGKFEHVEGIDQAARETFLLELEQATTEEQKVLAREKYNKTIQGLFDLVIDREDYQNTIEIVKNELISLKDNIFGLEVDSGKNDIITGKIKMNLAWSGDAVYSIDQAMEASGKVLEYYVPEEGANVWYDGWVLPNKANRELACKFIDFLSEPVNAMRNMDYIGYTSFIACDEIFDLISSWYGVSSYYEEGEYFASYYSEEDGEQVDGSIVEYNGKFYECIKDSQGNLPINEEYFIEVDKDELDIGEAYDLGFIFSDKFESERSGVLYPYNDCYNQLIAQYPDEDTIARCAVMNDFSDRNDEVVIMWSQVKAYTDMTPYYIVLFSSVGIIVIYFVTKLILKNKSTRNKRRLEDLTK